MGVRLRPVASVASTLRVELKQSGDNPGNKFPVWYPTASPSECAIDTTGHDIR
ncbi:MAG: hypothetical protein MUE44_19105 [Oscillatoriaceae cyanobacterium Prado104]|nr:hypothetical protein [Oscillatoriaceae cyanobacterium Prado104]